MKPATAAIVNRLPIAADTSGVAMKREVDDMIHLLGSTRRLTPPVYESSDDLENDVVLKTLANRRLAPSWLSCPVPDSGGVTKVVH